ncbi:unnamed protein product [Prorocentrum cordatum]|uniref:Uncharacterized protein n=1 Tax=Prorocentrum cordatum TaxID=2364126 RepID=A0ABN9TQN8_9DINO|nr:unnamed protein product [Polarella glacialis]
MTVTCRSCTSSVAVHGPPQDGCRARGDPPEPMDRSLLLLWEQAPRGGFLEGRGGTEKLSDDGGAEEHASGQPRGGREAGRAHAPLRLGTHPP